MPHLFYMHEVLQQVKEYNNGEFGCNGGAFFWVAFTDDGGSWSDVVWDEVQTTSGESVLNDELCHHYLFIHL